MIFKYNKSTEPFKKTLKFLIIFLCLLAFGSPIFLLWNVEISMEFKPDVYLTNGMQVVKPIQVYHLWIYVTLVSISVLVLIVLFNLDKILELNYKR